MGESLHDSSFGMPLINLGLRRASQTRLAISVRENQSVRVCAAAVHSVNIPSVNAEMLGADRYGGSSSPGCHRQILLSLIASRGNRSLEERWKLPFVTVGNSTRGILTYLLFFVLITGLPLANFRCFFIITICTPLRSLLSFKAFSSLVFFFFHSRMKMFFFLVPKILPFLFLRREINVFVDKWICEDRMDPREPMETGRQGGALPSTTSIGRQLTLSLSFFLLLLPLSLFTLSPSSVLLLSSRFPFLSRNVPIKLITLYNSPPSNYFTNSINPLIVNV